MAMRYAHGIQPIQKHEMIFARAPVGSLWGQWNNDWLRRIGVVAVVDTRYRFVGILRPTTYYTASLKRERAFTTCGLIPTL